MGGAELALVRASWRAREGNAAAVAVQLAEAFGWLPPSPEEQAAEWERLRRLRAPQPAPQRGQPWTRPDVSSVDVGEYGREIYQPRYPPHPLDSYWGWASPAPGRTGRATAPDEIPALALDAVPFPFPGGRRGWAVSRQPPGGARRGARGRSAGPA